MTAYILKEVNAPYTVRPDDEALGRETVIIRRNGEPIAAVVPYAEYQALLALRPAPDSLAAESDPEFERNRAAFERLLPELLREHRGEWVAIVDERPVQFGPDFQSVIATVRERFGGRSVYIRPISEAPRVYQLGGPRLAPGQTVPPPVWEES